MLRHLQVVTCVFFDFVLLVRVSVGGFTFIPGLLFFETVFTTKYHQSKRPVMQRLLAFPQVANKTINRKARFLRPGYLTSTFMVT